MACSPYSYESDAFETVINIDGKKKKMRVGFLNNTNKEHPADEINELLHLLIGKEYEMKDIISLSGIEVEDVEDIKVFVINNNKNDIEVSLGINHKRIATDITTSFSPVGYHAITLLKKKDEKPSMSVDNFYLKDDSPYLTGTRIMSKIIKRAKDMGISKITLYATRSAWDDPKQDIGYFVWPKFGFDAKLSAIYGTDDYRRFTVCPYKKMMNKSLQDFINKSDENKEAWKDSGRPCRLSFDLNNAIQWNIFQKYIESKQIN